MGSEIASLYAKLGLDSSQFQKGLTDSKGKLAGFFSTIDKSPLGAFTKQLTGVGLSSLSVAGAAAKITDEIGKAITATSEYTTSIEDMSRLLGISAEDTSRLVQASDDLFISQDKLKVALQAASRQGIDVSIKGLKDLSKQYLSLNPGVERAQFLMTTFGRSGADMGKLLEVGAVGIDAATAAISDSLIVTDEAIEKNRKYKQSLDTLNDSLDGIKYTVGGGFIDALNGAFHGLEGLDNFFKTGKFWPEATNKSMQAWTDSLNAQAEAYYKLHPELKNVVDDTTALFDATTYAADAMKKYSDQLLFNMAAAKLDDEAQLQLAYKMGLVDEATVTASTKQAEFKKMLDDGKISTGEYTTLIAGLGSAIAGLQSKNVTVTVDHYDNYYENQGNSRARNGTTATPHASGGSFMIPMGYGYEGYRMPGGQTASGGETVTITPKGKESASQVILTDEQLKKIGEASGNATAMKLMQLGML